MQQSKSTSTPPEETRSFRKVIPVGLTSLFTDIASEMVLALLPLFIVESLAGNALLLGLMEGAADAVNNIFRVISGIFVDLLPRRKPLMIIGYGLSAFTKPLFGITARFTDVLTVRLVDRVGKGIRTSPRDALITESVKDNQRSQAFGFHRAMDQSGAVIGPLLAFLLFPLLGYRGVFVSSIIPGIIAVSILVVFVRDTALFRKTSISLRDLRPILSFELVSFLAVIGIFTLGAYSFAFVLLKASLLGVDAGSIPLIYATLNLATVLVAVPLGTLADRIGNPKVLLIAYTFFLLTNIGNFAVSSGVLFAFLLAAGYGLFLGTSDTVQRSLIPGLVPENLKGSGYALYYAVIAISSFAANIVFGLLWNFVAVGSAYLYTLATSVVGIVGLVFLIAEQRFLSNEEESSNSLQT